jgi:hypothetical protein
MASEIPLPVSRAIEEVVVTAERKESYSDGVVVPAQGGNASKRKSQLSVGASTAPAAQLTPQLGQFALTAQDNNEDSTADLKLIDSEKQDESDTTSYHMADRQFISKEMADSMNLKPGQVRANGFVTEIASRLSVDQPIVIDLDAELKRLKKLLEKGEMQEAEDQYKVMLQLCSKCRLPETLELALKELEEE